MRNRIAKLLLGTFLASVISGVSYAAIPLHTGPVDPSNIRGILNSLIVQVNSALSLPVAPLSTQGITFSISSASNPLLLVTSQDIPTASVNAAGGGYGFVAGTSGRTIFPSAITVMVSGTASAATSLKVVCEPSGMLLATLPVGVLVTNAPVNPFVSGTAGQALARGCASGDGVFVSTVGTNLATTTDVFVNMPYTVQ